MSESGRDASETRSKEELKDASEVIGGQTEGEATPGPPADASPATTGGTPPTSSPSSRTPSFLPSAEMLSTATSATAAMLSSLSVAPSALFNTLYSATTSSPTNSSPPSSSPILPPPPPSMTATATVSSQSNFPQAQPSALRTLIAPHTQRIQTLTANTVPNVLALPRHLVRGSTAPDELARAAKVFAGVAEVSTPRTETSLDKIIKDALDTSARWNRLVEQGGKDLNEIGQALDYSGKMWTKKE